MFTEYPRHSCLHDLFDRRARARPDDPAAAHAGRSLSYGALRRRSELLAERLRTAGTTSGDLVGVCGSRSPEALVAFLGILKAGAAYVPLDEQLPPARVRAMAEDAQVRTAVRLPGSEREIRGMGRHVEIPDDTGIDTGLDHAAAAPAPAVATTDRAYVMFTSGSTGRPKPVAIPHRGIVRLAVSDPALPAPTTGDGVLHAFDLSSDASTIEIWSALLGGARLVLLDREQLLSPVELEAEMRREHVTIAYLTTGVFHHVARTRPAALSGLRFASAGGEAMDPDLARAVVDSCPGTTVVNFYGPTENSVVSTHHRVREVPTAATGVPIGRPIANSTCHVVRPDGTDAAVGEEGELLVGGDGLAIEYLGDPQRTAQRFTEHPGDPGTRVYRTGDRARWRPDGELEHLGRYDRQVKLRGHRIELDEVEARLRAHPSVGEAVVELDEQARALVGYVTPGPDRADATVPTEQVRRELAGWLPAQSVPARMIALPRFPLTRSGKVDRDKLPKHTADADTARDSAGTARDSGASHLQRSIADIWKRTLRIAPAADDDFFLLGGDSLLASEVVTRTLAEHGIDAQHGSGLIRDLLRESTLSAYTTAVRDVLDRDRTGPATSVDFRAEARLGFALPDARGPEPRPDAPSNVLITGTTGFVGAFLLDRFLRTTRARVHCPVRARDEQHARQRVFANLDRYGLQPGVAVDRVHCVPADLGRSNLGLDESRAAELQHRIDLIVHAAAQVNFLYPYPALRESNVEATRAVLRFAAARRIPTHFLSTIAVLAGFGTAGQRHVDEDEPLQHVDRLTMGYAESKWVAERLLQQAAQRGLPIAIHRPYEITGDRARGTCNTETAICALFRMITETGLAPDIALPLDFVPVDHLADVVAHLATRRRADRRVYHLTNPRPALLRDMVERMRVAGYEIRTLPWDEWVSALVRHVAEHPTSPTAPFVSLCVDRGNKTDMSVKEMFLERTFPRFGRRNVDRDLRGSGLTCPPVDAELLDRYLEYFMTSGYLPRPAAIPG